MSYLIRYLIVLTVLLLLFTIGCSRDSSNPVMTSELYDEETNITQEGESSRVFLGLYDLNFDTGSESVEMVQARDANFHINVSNYLFPPTCSDCVQYRVIHYFPNAKVLNAAITVKNPTTLTAYDVRGIVYSTFSNPKPLRNPDGYTPLFDIADSNPATINPFIAFGKETANRNLAGGKSQTAVFGFHFPGAWTVRIAFDASYPTHCEEPYYIGDFYLEYPLQATENYESNARVFVKDWQNNVSSVIMSIPGVTASVIGFYQRSSWWRTDIMNELNAEPGIYTGVIRAESSGQYLYQYVDVEVSRYSSIDSVVESCMFTKDYDGYAEAGFPIIDNESLYFTGGKSNDIDFFKVGNEYCNVVESTPYNFSVPSTMVMDNDYIYAFGKEKFCLIQKDYLGLNQKTSFISAYVKDLVKEGDMVWLVHSIGSTMDFAVSQYDLSDPRNPLLVWTIPWLDYWRTLEIEKKGKYLFILSDNTDTERSMVSIISAENGEKFDSWESDSEILYKNLAVLGDYIYLGIIDMDTSTTPDYSFLVLMVTDLPWDIEFVRNAGVPFESKEVSSEAKIVNDVLYVFHNTGPLYPSGRMNIYDLSEPWFPEFNGGSFDIEDIPSYGTYFDFLVHRDNIYVFLWDPEFGGTSNVSFVKYDVNWK